MFLGPSINKCCFEVGMDVAGKFSNQFIIRKEDKLYIDLKKKVCVDILNFGLSKKNLILSDVCTYESNECFSFRKNKTEKRMNAFFGYN